jgi:hypothetical protein
MGLGGISKKKKDILVAVPAWILALPLLISFGVSVTGSMKGEGDGEEEATETQEA